MFSSENVELRLGYRPTPLGAWAEGVYNPTIVVLHAIATRLEIRITDLIHNTRISESWAGLDNL